MQELIVIDDLLSALIGIEGRYISIKRVRGKEDSISFQVDASMDLALQVWFFLMVGKGKKEYMNSCLIDLNVMKFYCRNLKSLNFPKWNFKEPEIALTFLKSSVTRIYLFKWYKFIDWAKRYKL